jgi:hypothetical protein
MRRRSARSLALSLSRARARAHLPSGRAYTCVDTIGSNHEGNIGELAAEESNILRSPRFFRKVFEQPLGAGWKVDLSVDGRQMCDSHDAFGTEEATARGANSDGGFEERLRRWLRVEICQQDKKRQGNPLSEDEVHTIEAKVAAMHRGEGGDFSGRVDAQILGVVRDVRRQGGLLPWREEFIERDQRVMVLDT